MSPDGNKQHLCTFTAMARATSACLGLARPFTADEICGVIIGFEGTRKQGVKAVDEAKLLQLLATRGVSQDQFRAALFVNVLDAQTAQLLRAHIARVDGMAAPAAAAGAGESEDEEEEEEDEEEKDTDARMEAAAGVGGKPDAGNDSDEEPAQSAQMYSAGCEEAHALFVERTARIDAFVLAAGACHAAGLGAAPSEVTSCAASAGAPLGQALSATPSLRGLMLLNEHPDLLGALAAAPSSDPMFGGPSSTALGACSAATRVAAACARQAVSDLETQASRRRAFWRSSPRPGRLWS
jgi:ribosomal protein L12E/L44/L45/RPP1/RPP2